MKRKIAATVELTVFVELDVEDEKQIQPDSKMEYTKKEVQSILGLSVNELNKWLGFLAIESKEKKKRGVRGRPTYTFGINDLYNLGLFKALKGAGLNRKSVAKIIQDVDLQNWF